MSHRPSASVCKLVCRSIRCGLAITCFMSPTLSTMILALAIPFPVSASTAWKEKCQAFLASSRVAVVLCVRADATLGTGLAAGASTERRSRRHPGIGGQKSTDAAAIAAAAEAARIFTIAQCQASESFGHKGRQRCGGGGRVSQCFCRDGAGQIGGGGFGTMSRPTRSRARQSRS